MLKFWSPRRWFENMERAQKKKKKGLYKDCEVPPSDCCTACCILEGKFTNETLLKLSLEVIS